jgi:hypothetical protein
MQEGSSVDIVVTLDKCRLVIRLQVQSLFEASDPSNLTIRPRLDFRRARRTFLPQLISCTSCMFPSVPLEQSAVCSLELEDANLKGTEMTPHKSIQPTIVDPAEHLS